MADEISIGTHVQIPAGSGRPYAVVAKVVRIEAEQVWVERFGTKKIGYSDLRVETRPNGLSPKSDLSVER